MENLWTSWHWVSTTMCSWMWRQPAKNAPGLMKEIERWYALHVRSRHEKAVAAALRCKDFAEFLPLYTSRRQWSQRVAEVELPLFPGYVFCSFDPGEKRVLITTTPGVMGI